MSKKTCLYEQHVLANGKIVDFAGWAMPLHYGSQLEEHHHVRKSAGVFDVSHMAILDLHGDKIREFLRYLLANNVDRLKTSGKALYTCALNEQGGVIDDLIVYYLEDTWFRIVVNAATREKDLAWFRKHATGYGVDVKERTDLAMIAVQGPAARNLVHEIIAGPAHEKAASLTPFNALYADPLFIARTGYTGEDGYEIMAPQANIVQLWTQLLKVGVRPIGLGARDTLRLEAGMNLYGTDMDDMTTPLESGLTWTVAWEPADRDFIGRQALEAQRKQGVKRKLVGLLLNEKGVFRNHQKVFVNGSEVGEITSGSFSPTLNQAVAFARVASEINDCCQVEMRGKQVDALIVKPPFVRHGKRCVN